MPRPKYVLDYYFRPESRENQILLDSNHFFGTQGSRNIEVKYDPALPSELGRSYVVSADGTVTSLAVAAGFDSAEHAAELFENDPSGYNAILENYNFSNIFNPQNGDTYVYFAPGSSTPQRIFKNENDPRFELAEITNSKVNKALRSIQRERSNMDMLHVQAEKEMHEAEVFMNDVNRVHHDIYELFGSDVSDGGPENGSKNYTQKTISNLLKEAEDYSYEETDVLSEDQVAAITMLCVADPALNGTGEGKAREASAANNFNMIVADLYIERDGRHHGQYYETLKRSRAQAKELIKDFSKTNDPSKIAKLVVESFEIAALTARHNPGRTNATYGNMQPAYQIDELLKNPDIKNAVFEYAKANAATNEKAARFEEMYMVHKERISLLNNKKEAVGNQFFMGRKALDKGTSIEDLKAEYKEVKFDKAILKMLDFASDREREHGYGAYTEDEEVRKSTIRFNELQGKKNRTQEETMEMLNMLNNFNDYGIYFPNMKADNPIQKLLTSPQVLETKEFVFNEDGVVQENFRVRNFENILEDFIKINAPEFIEEPNQANFDKLMDMMINQGIIPQDPPKIKDDNEVMAAAEKYYKTLEKFDAMEIAKRMQERIDFHNEYKKGIDSKMATTLTAEEKAIMEENGLDLADVEALAANKDITVNQYLGVVKLQSDIAEVKNMGATAGEMDAKGVTEAFRTVINLSQKYNGEQAFLIAAAEAGTKLAKIISDNKNNPAFKPKISSKEFDAMKKVIIDGKNAQKILTADTGIKKDVAHEEKVFGL